MTDLLHALNSAARWLPHQGPLAGFVHSNPLAELEERPFDQALDLAARVLHAEVRLSEAEYREMLADGRIREATLREVFGAEALETAQPIAPGLPSAHELGWALLRHGLDDTHWRIRAFEVSEGRPDAIVSRLDRRCQALLASGARQLFSRDRGEALRLLVGQAQPEVVQRRLRLRLGIDGPQEALRTCMEQDDRAAEMGFAMIAGAAFHGLARRDRPPVEELDPEALEREVDEVLLPVVAAFLDQGQSRARPEPSQGLLAVGRIAILRRRQLRPHAAPLLGGQPWRGGATTGPRNEPGIRRLGDMGDAGVGGAAEGRSGMEGAGEAPALPAVSAWRLGTEAA